MNVFDAIHLHFENKVVNSMLCVSDHHKEERIIALSNLHTLSPDTELKLIDGLY